MLTDSKHEVLNYTKSFPIFKKQSAVSSLKIDEDIEGCEEFMCSIYNYMKYLSINMKPSLTVQDLCRLYDRMNECAIQVKDISITRYQSF